jgi:hypothetical protein
MTGMTFYVLRTFEEDPYDGALVEQPPQLCSSANDVEWVANRMLREGAVGAVGYREAHTAEGRRGSPVIVFRRGRVPREWV